MTYTVSAASFNYSDPKAYTASNLDVSSLIPTEIVNNYAIAKGTGILSRISQQQAKDIAAKNPKGWDLNHFGPTNALAIVNNIASSKVSSLVMPTSSRFFMEGNLLRLGDVKTPIPKDFSGDISYDKNKKTFILKPNAPLKNMPNLKPDETVEIEATDKNSVTLEDGTIISSKMVLSIKDGKQTLSSLDGRLKITKDGQKSTIDNNGQKYETDAKITIRGETNPAILLSSNTKSANSKDKKFYVSKGGDIRVDLLTSETFELGGNSANRIIFDSKANDVSIYAIGKVTLGVNYKDGKKQVNDVTLGNLGQASVQIGFSENDKKETISKLSRLSGTITVSEITIDEKGVHPPSDLKGKELLANLPDEILYDPSKEIWKKGTDVNNIYTSGAKANSGVTATVKLGDAKVNAALEYIKNHEDYYQDFRKEALALYGIDLPADINELKAEHINLIASVQSARQGFHDNWVDGKPGPRTVERTNYAAGKEELYAYAKSQNIKTDGRSLSAIITEIQKKLNVPQTGNLGSDTLTAMGAGKSSNSKIGNLIQKGIYLSDKQDELFTKNPVSIVSDYSPATIAKNSGGQTGLTVAQGKAGYQKSRLNGINEMAYQNLAYNEGSPNGRGFPGHDTHVHYGFTDPQVALGVIQKAQEMGLTTTGNYYVGRSPYSVNHASGSFHYSNFGTYNGRTLGRGLDVSGGTSQARWELFRWTEQTYGNRG